MTTGADKEALAKEHMDLVEKLTSMMIRRLCSEVSRDDVRSYALEGLAKAIDRFEPERGLSFKTFAGHKIKGAIYDGLSEADWLPRRLKRQITFLRKADDLLEARRDTPPPQDRTEAAHRLAGSLRELAATYVTTFGTDNAPEAQTATPAEAEYTIDRERFSRELTARVDSLPEKQARVVRRYFYGEQTLDDIAKASGRSKSWASRVLSQGLDTLRSSYENETPPTPETYAPST